jgi:hypothetical protein
VLHACLHNARKPGRSLSSCQKGCGGLCRRVHRWHALSSSCSHPNADHPDHHPHPHQHPKLAAQVSQWATRANTTTDASLELAHPEQLPQPQPQSGAHASNSMTPPPAAHTGPLRRSGNTSMCCYCYCYFYKICAVVFEHKHQPTGSKELSLCKDCCGQRKCHAQQGGRHAAQHPCQPQGPSHSRARHPCRRRNLKRVVHLGTQIDTCMDRVERRLGESCQALAQAALMWVKADVGKAASRAAYLGR